MKRDTGEQSHKKGGAKQIADWSKVVGWHHQGGGRLYEAESLTSSTLKLSLQAVLQRCLQRKRPVNLLGVLFFTLYVVRKKNPTEIQMVVSQVPQTLSNTDNKSKLHQSDLISGDVDFKLKPLSHCLWC